jgi:hypothetical protein
LRHYQTEVGLEVRAGYRDDDGSRASRPIWAVCGAFAEAYKRTLTEDIGSVEELPLS